MWLPLVVADFNNYFTIVKDFNNYLRELIHGDLCQLAFFKATNLVDAKR